MSGTKLFRLWHLVSTTMAVTGLTFLFPLRLFSLASDLSPDLAFAFPKVLTPQSGSGSSALIFGLKSPKSPFISKHPLHPQPLPIGCEFYSVVFVSFSIVSLVYIF